MLDVHRPDRRVVLVSHGLEAAAALLEVTANAADQPDIGIGIDEDLDVHLLAQHRLGEHEDALHDHHARRLHPPRRRRTGVGGEVVDRDVDRLTVAQGTQMHREQVALERCRVVVVNLHALVEREVRLVAVVGVVLDRHGAAGHRGRELVRDGGLPGARTAGDSNDQRTRGLGHRAALYYSELIDDDTIPINNVDSFASMITCDPARETLTLFAFPSVPLSGAISVASFAASSFAAGSP